jgi:LacI family transcriptional regulator
MMAMGAILAIQESGLNVPQDIAVVGFDDIPPARLVNPPLTTVTQFQVALGRRSAELLFDRLSGTAPPHGRTIEMPYQLVIRKSA